MVEGEFEECQVVIDEWPTPRKLFLDKKSGVVKVEIALDDCSNGQNCSSCAKCIWEVERALCEKVRPENWEEGHNGGRYLLFKIGPDSLLKNKPVDFDIVAVCLGRKLSHSITRMKE